MSQSTSKRNFLVGATMALALLCWGILWAAMQVDKTTWKEESQLDRSADPLVALAKRIADACETDAKK